MNDLFDKGKEVLVKAEDLSTRIPEKILGKIQQFSLPKSKSRIWRVPSNIFSFRFLSFQMKIELESEA